VLIYAGLLVGENYPAIEAALKPWESVIYALVLGAVALLLVRWWWARRAAG
jgi:membrane protein DedA with SNARE-associated domain